jgi:phospholipid/cholesterol/gamma-HCH transport system substrate-binding protein
MRKLSRSDFETLIGALAMAIVALALWGASAGGKAARGGDGYVVTARFDQVDGLTVGSPVYLAGIRVGSIEKIELAPGTLKAEVTMSIRRGINLPADSAALVMSDGVLGSKFMRIEAGSAVEVMKPGDRFEIVQDSVIVEQILQKIVQGAELRRRGEEPKPPEKKPDEPEKKPDALSLEDMLGRAIFLLSEGDNKEKEKK